MSVTLGGNPPMLTGQKDVFVVWKSPLFVSCFAANHLLSAVKRQLKHK